VQNFLLSTYLRQGCKTVFTTFLREFFLRLLQTLLVVVYFYASFDTQYFLSLFIGTFIVQALLLLMYSLANPLQKNKKTIEQPKTIEKFSYIVYNFLGTVAQAIIHHIDIVLIFLYTQNRVSQEEAFVQVSIYSVLKYMATLVIIPQRSIAEAAIPQMVRHLQGKSFTALEKLSRQTSLLQLIIATFIALALAINSKDIFTFVRVIRPEQLSMVQPVFLILLLLKIIKSKFETQNGLYILSDLYRSDIILQCIFALISIFLGKYAVQKGGLLGIAASNLFIFISLQLLRDKIIQPHFTSQQKSLWPILLGILILGGILYLFFLTFDFPYAPWVNIILRTGLCAVIYGMSLVLLGGRCCGER
jgi:O-antigen/teichoic acid export membrane protein